MCVHIRSIAVGTQFSSWEAMLKDTEEEAKVIERKSVLAALPLSLLSPSSSFCAPLIPTYLSPSSLSLSLILFLYPFYFPIYLPSPLSHPLPPSLPPSLLSSLTLPLSLSPFPYSLSPLPLFTAVIH